VGQEKHCWELGVLPKNTTLGSNPVLLESSAQTTKKNFEQVWLSISYTDFINCITADLRTTIFLFLFNFCLILWTFTWFDQYRYHYCIRFTSYTCHCLWKYGISELSTIHENAFWPFQSLLTGLSLSDFGKQESRQCVWLLEWSDG